MTVGMTKHAVLRVRERIPVLREVSRERIKREVELMIYRGRPTSAPRSGHQYIAATHDESGIDVVLVMKVQRCGTLLLVTCLTRDQAREQRRDGLKVHRRIRRTGMDADVRRKIRDGYRNAANEFEME